ncbi:hypothetical protein BGX26_012484 [Mortierella sp. AD094]|nr:hypothetical protein BGX26_012484 [Mortierella sp. AD094]
MHVLQNQCTYRGRGLTYLFFGCLVASRIAFNLYGGIIVVCMGLAFFILSYVKMIPPLDGLILNYRKLDQWKEQKHFRVQLEAQRIFEQQLQQEQNLTRMIPAHHHNSLTVHAHMTMNSPKQIRPFPAMNAGSTNFSGTGAGVGAGSGAGALTSMFSPPLSLHHPSAPGQQQCGDRELQFPHHQIQTKPQDSTSQECLSNSQASRAPSDGTTSTQGGNMDRVAIGRGKGRLIQSRVPQEEQSISEAERLQLDKSLPPIVTSELESFNTIVQPTSVILSPPPTRLRNAMEFEPGSPLQYLNAGGEDLVEPAQNSAAAVAPGNKTEYHGGQVGDSILKSALHPIDPNSHQQTTQQQQKANQIPKLDQQQFPLRTTNKPTPPHDPFRKTSISSTHTTHTNLLPNLNSATPTNPVQPNPIAKNGRAQYQSLYRPPEPPGQGDKIHPFQLSQQLVQYYNDPSAANRQIPMPLTATGQILSSIGGISGCYAIVGGVPGTAALAATAVAAPISFSSHNYGGPHYSSSNTPRHPKPTSQHQPQPHLQQQQQPQPVKQQHDAAKRYMPDIVLTLPTPAEPGNSSRRDEYFAV